MLAAAIWGEGADILVEFPSDRLNPGAPLSSRPHLDTVWGHLALEHLWGHREAARVGGRHLESRI